MLLTLHWRKQGGCIFDWALVLCLSFVPTSVKTLIPVTQFVQHFVVIFIGKIIIGSGWGRTFVKCSAIANAVNVSGKAITASVKADLL